MLATLCWMGLAGWWAHTHQEFVALSDSYPVAATVLAGSLLEAALTAIAQPAQLAGEWKRPFLNDDPKTWQLKHLIGQAEAAKTFSEDDASLASALVELRNRIHVGKFAGNGAGRFQPPYTNAHEAHVAKAHLDLLLARILEWPPVAKLC